MKHFLIFLLVLCPCLTGRQAWSIVHGQVCHVAYVEKHNGMERSLTARVGKEIVLGEVLGTFPADLKAHPPWYLTGFPAFEKEIQIALEGLPPLLLHREFHCHSDPPLAEKNPDCRVSLKLSAKQESLPLNEEEAQVNALLKPFGVDEVFLEGTGRQWLESEEFLLKGHLVKEGKKEPLEISWARGKLPW
ncbi:MAG: hypothetical protein Q8P84_06250 [Deltaproteobacteria bacterium]|nr:hypothetical protein [Deltaproteobacteria bacterium]